MTASKAKKSWVVVVLCDQSSVFDCVLDYHPLFSEKKKKKNAVELAHAPKSFSQALFPALPQSTRAPPCSAHLCFEDAVTFSALLPERLFSIFHRDVQSFK